MEQLRALNALEPFLVLSKSASSSRAAADLISQATSSPNTFIFAELLHMPNIQALRQSKEYVSHLTLLEIFAWGTIADYNKISGLPKLSPKQKQKLLLLSLLPLATSVRPLTYKHLLGSLSLSSVIELESLVTEAIYAQLIEATIDPKAQIVHISSVAPLRDLAPGSLQELLSTYKEWEAHCDTALQNLDEEIQSIRLKAKKKLEREARIRAVLEDRLAEKTDEPATTTKAGKRGARDENGEGMGEEDGMDVDGDIGGVSRTYPSKRTLLGR